MSILDTVVALNEIDTKSIKIIMGEVGSGKTSFLKDMPEIAGGDILYIAVGNDKGFNQLKSNPAFKTLPNPVKTTYVEKKGKRIAIKDRVLPQIIELLEAYQNDDHDFHGLTIDAISTIQEQVEEEIKFETNKNVEWEGWAAIKKGMFRVYSLCEEIAENGHEVALQSHFQIREHEDTYSGEKMSRTLPMMTENNAIRILKNADAVVFIKIMSDKKDPQIVHRMSIVGGHTTIPTKIRNEHNLSFDKQLFENLTYGGLIKLMQIETIEEAADLDGVIIKVETGKKGKKPGAKSKSKVKAKKEDEPEVEEKEVKAKAKTKVKSKTKSKTKTKEKVEDEVEEEETEEEESTRKPLRKPKTKSKSKAKVKAKKEEVEDEPEPEVEKEAGSRPKPKKNKTSSKSKSKTKSKAKTEDKFEDDDELEEENLFEED
jgi:hypothetical protein